MVPEGDYRVVSFAGDVQEVLSGLPPRPVLVGASLGGFTSMLLAGSSRPGLPALSSWSTSCPIWSSPGRTESTTSWQTGWSRVRLA